MVVALYQIERELARRTGPYALLVSSGAGGGSTFRAKTLQSTIELGGVTNLHVLRRDRDTAGAAIPSFDVDDRTRRVVPGGYDQANGEVTVDRAWEGVTPTSGEEVELTHLHPDELRICAIAGLRRTFFNHRATITLAASASEYDLSTDLPWVTTEAAIKGVGWNYPSSTTPPKWVNWRDFVQNTSGGVSISVNAIYPNRLIIESRRPHTTYYKPNGGAYGTQATEPSHDNDELRVKLSYAVAFAHCEAWRLYPWRLQGPASAGRQLTLEMVSDEATLERIANYPRNGQGVPPLFSSEFGLVELQRA